MSPVAFSYVKADSVAEKDFFIYQHLIEGTSLSRGSLSYQAWGNSVKVDEPLSFQGRSSTARQVAWTGM